MAIEAFVTDYKKVLIGNDAYTKVFNEAYMQSATRVGDDPEPPST